MNTDMARLRTKLREINIAHSALVRREADQDRPVRLAELRHERRALMTIIAACGEHAEKVRAPLHALSVPLHMLCSGEVVRNPSTHPLG